MLKRNPFARLRDQLPMGGAWPLASSLLTMLEQSLYGSGETTRSAPFVRDADNVQRQQLALLIATLPSWLLGLWSVGQQSAAADRQDLATASTVVSSMLLGLWQFLQPFLLIFVVASLWTALFATLRRRPPDQGVLLFAWIFTLALPAGAPLAQVAIGASFGLVFGRLIYGGAGFHLVNPIVLGLIFLWLAYPAAVTPAPAQVEVSRWLQFVGERPGGLGSTSVLGCVIGASLLLLTRVISWRVLLGALLGMGMARLVPGVSAAGLVDILLSGALVFGLVFLATDPAPGSMTNPGRWGYGVAVGILTMLVQHGNTAIGEPVLFAIFLASLIVPLIDAVVIALHTRRRKRRLETR